LNDPEVLRARRTASAVISAISPDGISAVSPAARGVYSTAPSAHYWGHAGFLEEGQLIADAERLGEIPTFLAHGRRDISAPADVAVTLAAAIPDAQLFISDAEGHGTS